MYTQCITLNLISPVFISDYDNFIKIKNKKMEILVGRLTTNALVKVISDEKKVVLFTIDVNDSYKSKSSEKMKRTVK